MKQLHVIVKKNKLERKSLSRQLRKLTAYYFDQLKTNNTPANTIAIARSTVLPYPCLFHHATSLAPSSARFLTVNNTN